MTPEHSNVSQELIERLNKASMSTSQRAEALIGGGGGGTFDGMEARVTALEELAKDTRGSLESIQRQLARIDSKLDGKPDQGWVLNAIGIIFGLVLAAMAAATGLFALMK